MKKITLLLLVLTTFGFSQNGGDTCATAVAVTPGSYAETDINSGTGGSVNDVGNSAAWFVYTATADGFVNVTGCPYQFELDNTRVYISSGDCSNLTYVADGDNECIFSADVVFEVVNGVDYYIEWTDINNSNPFNWDLVFSDCAPPIVDPATAISDITTSGATLSWQPGGSEMSWDVEVFDEVQNVSVETITDIDTPSYTFTTLNEDNEYSVSVRTNCGGDVSFWSDSVTFMTDTTCPKPVVSFGTAVTDITATTAVISWAVGDSETMWEIALADSTAGENINLGNFTTISGIDATTYTLENLTPLNDYWVHVRADCGGGDYSLWVLAGIFETLSPPINPIDYLNDFSDWPGDGWTEAGNGLPSEGPQGGNFGDWTDQEFGNQTNGSDSARLNLFSSGDEEWLISPSFALSAGETYYLDMDVACTDYNDTFSSPMGPDDEVRVLISPNDGGNWLTLRTWGVANQPSAAGEAMEQIDLSIYAGNTIKIALWGTDGAVNDSEDTDFFVDNFRITSPTLNLGESNFEGFKLFPNPVDNTLNLIAKASIDHVIIHNIMGQEVMNLKPKVLSYEVGMSGLDTGLYMVTVTINGNHKTFKVVKD